MNNRPDISNYLAHFTKNAWPLGNKDVGNSTNEFKKLTAYKRLLNILYSKTIFESQLPWLGKNKAVCLTECPWTSLIGHTERYSPYGVGFSKEFIFSKGGGPIFYIRADIYNWQQWDANIMPFLTPFWPDYVPAGLKKSVGFKKCDYTHEREWRVVGNLTFEYSDISFIVLPDYNAMAKFPKELKDNIGRDKFLLMDNYKHIEELWPVHKLK